MTNVIFVVVTIVYVQIVPVCQMVITWKITVTLVMLTAPMTVYRIVQEHGVVIQQLMNVIFVMVIIHPVLTVMVYQMVKTWKITAVHVTVIAVMTVYRIVLEHEVAV